MCRWAIMACSRSLSLASCGEVGGEQGLCLVAGRGRGGQSGPPPPHTKPITTMRPRPWYPSSLRPLLLEDLGFSLPLWPLTPAKPGLGAACSMKPSPLLQTVCPQPRPPHSRCTLGGLLPNSTRLASRSRAEAVAEQHPSSVAPVCEGALTH